MKYPALLLVSLVLSGCAVGHAIWPGPEVLAAEAAAPCRCGYGYAPYPYSPRGVPSVANPYTRCSLQRPCIVFGVRKH